MGRKNDSFRERYPDIARHWRQIGLACVLVLLTGGMLGLERTVVPIYGDTNFKLSNQVLLTFICAFGIFKGAASLVVGPLADRYGRKVTLLIGWSFGVPVFFLIIAANSWAYVVAANLFLGVHQGLVWATTIFIMVDLVDKEHDGMIIGLNEFIGYSAVALVAFASGYHVHVNHDFAETFSFGAVFAVLGWILSWFVQDTRKEARAKAAKAERLAAEDDAEESALIPHSPRESVLAKMSFGRALWMSFKVVSFDNMHVFACCLAGFFNSFKDGIVWGLFPLFFRQFNLDMHFVSLLIGIYPMTWAITQLFSGVLYDKYGARWLITLGLWLESLAVLYIVWTPTVFLSDLPPERGFYVFLTGSVVLGIGTALLYPTLHVAVSHGVPSDYFASSIGVYKVWREMGYAMGAVIAGAIADAVSLEWALTAGACSVAFSGVFSMFYINDEKTDRLIPMHEECGCLCVVPREGVRSAVELEGDDNTY